jgi:N-acetylmuramoyl-L-alanine amidase
VSPSPVIAASEVPLPSATLAPTSVASAEPPPATSRPTAPPTPPPATAPPTTAPGATRQYTVRDGDTLYNIANYFGTTIEEIQDLNGISDPRLIRVGQVLLLP